MRRFKKLLASLSLLLSILIVSSGVTSFAVLPEGIKLGGSYSEVLRQDYDHEKYQVHHLISKRAWNRLASEIRRKDGVKIWNRFMLCDKKQSWAPSILMEKEDHVKTLSYWNPCCSGGGQSKKYIDYQAKGLIKYGNIYELLGNEWRNIRRIFGNKYDEAMQQMYDYVKEAITFGPGEFVIRHPNRRWFVKYKFLEGEAETQV